jgi:multiple sugar transport system permease protein
MRTPLVWREAAANLWLAGPGVAAMVVLIFLPMAVVVALSFTDYQMGATSFQVVGFDNYIRLLTDRIGQMAVINTLIYAVIVVPCSMILGLLAALGLFRISFGTPRLSNIFKTVYFLPVAATLVAMAIAWQMLLHPSIGLVNNVLTDLALPQPAWLSDRGFVIYTLAVIGVWENLGYNMVLFLAGLAAIPRDLYDAAEIDGAHSSWDRFWSVTWPMLGPTTLFVLIVAATKAFRVFEVVATITRGGPGFSSTTLMYALYKEGFVYFKVGYASAITVVFLVILLVITYGQFYVVEKRVHYR